MTQPKTKRRPAESETRTIKEGHAEVLRLAREQKVRPTESIDDLRCSFWPANETEGIEQFDTWLREIREEESRPSRPE